MKKSMIAALLLSAGFSGYAVAEANVLQGRDFWNPVMIMNSTSQDIAYKVVSHANKSDNLYGVKMGREDTYHAGFGDKNATFYVGICAHMDYNGGRCSKLEPDTFKNCVNNVHYNAELVKVVQVRSPSICRVICLDGSSTSCLANY